MRRVSARRDADLMDRAPEAIAGMRVVMAEVGRPLARRGANEDEAEVGLELVGQFFQRGQSFRQQEEKWLTPMLTSPLEWRYVREQHGRPQSTPDIAVLVG